MKINGDMKKVYVNPLVDKLTVTVDILSGSDGSDPTTDVGNIEGGVNPEGGGGDSGALTGGYREWGNIWGN